MSNNNFLRRGKKLKELRNLLNGDEGMGFSESTYWLNRLSFRHIQFNIDQGSPSKKKSASPEEVTQIDIQSCVRFLVDLYSQWLQNSVLKFETIGSNNTTTFFFLEHAISITSGFVSIPLSHIRLLCRCPTI